MAGKKKYKYVKKTKLTNTDIYILKNYLLGVSASKIANELNITREQIIRHLDKIVRAINSRKEFNQRHSKYMWCFRKYLRERRILQKGGNENIAGKEGNERNESQN